MAENLPPVFVWPVPRSGGTLFATMLGVHPDLAMSYEIYESDLCQGDEVIEVGHAIHLLEAAPVQLAGSSSTRADDKWIRVLPRIPFRAFVARAHRGGLSPGELLAELRHFADNGGTFSTMDGRLDFIDQLMRSKMVKDGKRRWGGKARASLDKLGARHPKAAIFMVLRDGRDVLASRANRGSFDAEPERVAQEWIETLDDFERFMVRHAGGARIVQYERLVDEPRSVLQEVCEAAGLAFDESMLAYEKAQLTLLNHAHGHLSAAHIAEGLNARTVGRWRTDLSEAGVARFERIAGEHLERHGYSRS